MPYPYKDARQVLDSTKLNGDHHQLGTLLLLRMFVPEKSTRIHKFGVALDKEEFLLTFFQLGPYKISLQEVNSIHAMYKRITSTKLLQVYTDLIVKHYKW